MKVSIIQNCHNGETYLKDSLKSIQNQSYRNFELIFFDNNSNDRSEEIFKSFNDQRFKYFKSKKKLKLYKARNLAIQESSGDLIAFLDVDDWWDKNKIFKQVNCFKNNPDIDLVYTNYFIYSQFYKTKKKANLEKLPSGRITNSLIEDYKIAILTVMMKSDLFKKEGYSFDSNLTIIGDFDLFLRISQNCKFLYLNECLAYYRNHFSNYSNLHYNEEIAEFNYFLKKKDILNFLNDKQIQRLVKKKENNKKKILEINEINKKIYDIKINKFSIIRYIQLLILLVQKLYAKYK